MTDAVTFSEVTSILGEPRTRLGGEYVWMCPYCCDSHKDNMRFNEHKGLLWCFAEPEHSKEIVKQIYAKRKEEEYKSNYVPVKKVENIIPKWETNKEKYFEYMFLAQNYLLNNDELLDYIYKKRGLTEKTVEIMNWGYDYTENCFVIPIISLKYGTITDFELREKSSEKKIRRVGGGCATIAEIYGCNKSKSLFITEGMIDGVVLYQWMKEKGQCDFTIYSCSNGVASLLNCLNEICFANFNEVKLILDNDADGDKWTKKIIEKYPFIQDKRVFLKNKGVKDICDYYNKFEREDV